MKNDQTFIKIFLDFLNDETADARRAETGFMQHPYVQRYAIIFQQSLDATDYKALQADMVTRLKWANKKLVVKEKQVILDHLNEKAYPLPVRVSDKDGNQIVLMVSALANFALSRGDLVLEPAPLINGMESACWFALALIAIFPGKVKRCHLTGCDKWFNAALTRTVGYCTRQHGYEAERANARKRMWNMRNPDKQLKIKIATAPKRRGGRK